MTEKVWAALVDATYVWATARRICACPTSTGTSELQQALGALVLHGTRDAIFGAHTEEALRRFQLNWVCPPMASPAPTPMRRCATWPTPGSQGSYSQPGAPFGLRPCGRCARAQRRVPVRHR
ncbi:MAG: peptidoglycan-binding domain-containing protein [Eggerthella lenta]